MLPLGIILEIKSISEKNTSDWRSVNWLWHINFPVLNAYQRKVLSEGSLRFSGLYGSMPCYVTYDVSKLHQHVMKGSFYCSGQMGVPAISGPFGTLTGNCLSMGGGGGGGGGGVRKKLRHRKLSKEVWVSPH